MKEIDISTRKHKNAILLIDNCDYEWVRLFKWTPEERKNGLSVCRSRRNPSGSKHLVRIHRDIVRARSFEQVDHKNGNGLDNRRSNLRLCNNAQNQQNRIKRGAGKCGTIYKGVFERKNKNGPSGRYFAYISINKKRYNLGSFGSDVDAAKEYDSKALYYFEGFSRLNFPISETKATPIANVKRTS